MDYIRFTKEYSGFTKLGLQTVFFIGITNNRTQDYRGITQKRQDYISRAVGITKKKRRDYKKITKKSVGIIIRNRMHNWLPDFQLESTTFLPGIHVESTTFFSGILESRKISRIRHFLSGILESRNPGILVELVESLPLFFLESQQNPPLFFLESQQNPPIFF